MKFAVFASTLIVCVLHVAADLSSCLTVKDKDACAAASDEKSGEACVWCECKAIPSECVSASMAKRLPSAVFKCAAPRDAPSAVAAVPDLQLQERRQRLHIHELMLHAPILFTLWQARHGKQYSSEEEHAQRLSNFKDTLRTVALHNEKKDRTYTLEVNRFADQSWEEFSATRFGGLAAGQNCSATHSNTGNKLHAPHSGAVAPVSVDWRKKGAVSDVKDQGSCGSCWTFSTTGCLESHHYLRTGEMVLLSEQQLVDCAQDFDNNGCNGGLPSHAFEYIHSSGGLDTEDAYPYTAKDGSCKFVSDAVGATVRASYNITFQDEKELEQAVAAVGPVAVAFHVANDFQSYKGGVYNNPECATSPDKVNHAVLAVGYGTCPVHGDYWIIKNSWSSDWGEDGYFRMTRGTNACGIADCASYPLL